MLNGLYSGKRPRGRRVKEIKPRRPMNCNEGKIDEYTLALLYLVIHERQEGFGAQDLEMS